MTHQGNGHLHIRRKQSSFLMECFKINTKSDSTDETFISTFVFKHKWSFTSFALKENINVLKK